MVVGSRSRDAACSNVGRFDCPPLRSLQSQCFSGARKSFVRIIRKYTKALSTVHDLIVPFGDKSRLEPCAAFGGEAESALDRFSFTDVPKRHLARQLFWLTELWN